MERRKERSVLESPVKVPQGLEEGMGMSNLMGQEGLPDEAAFDGILKDGWDWHTGSGMGMDIDEFIPRDEFICMNDEFIHTNSVSKGRQAKTGSWL